MQNSSKSLEGDKLLMTSNRFDKENRRPWDIFELDMKTGEAQSLTDTMPLDTDSYDGCYLPDGRIMFVDTSGYQGGLVMMEIPMLEIFTCLIVRMKPSVV